jgi:DNA (cytosine-5)-methyltransferase 1
MIKSHASLFSGIGGFDLASSWMGWENVFQVEKDKECHKVLAKHFPTTKCYFDIKEFNGEEYHGAIDIISGGFPCQAFSFAGKRKGKADDRYLWPEMLRIIQEIKPTWVVGENVPGIVSMALDTVLSDLEDEGYSCQSFIIPACGVNAIHKRDRIWIVAYSESNRHRRILANSSANGLENGRETEQRTYGESETRGMLELKREDSPLHSRGARGGYRTRLRFPLSEPTICRGDDGVSYRLDGGRLISEKQRANSLKQLGNAIVPQVAYEIFRIIERYDRGLT